jgi:hypothetical protein
MYASLGQFIWLLPNSHHIRPVNPFAGCDASDKISTLVFQLPAFHLAVGSEVVPTRPTKADDEFAFWTGSARP